MISKLRQENLELREKLKQLRLKGISFGENFHNIGIETITNRQDTTFGFLNDHNSDIQRYTMLSDKAKVVRGEASKRIGVLLHDWKEFKERTENELRRRVRSEQNLKDLITRKDREIEELSYELSSYRSLTMEQKNSIELLLEEKQINEKCKARSEELEKQLSRVNRQFNELSCDYKSCEEMIRSLQSEKESLLSLNAELRCVNGDQKKKIEMCERDVTDTGHELEMLEDMVRALNDRKSTLTSSSSPRATNDLQDRSGLGSDFSPFPPGQHFSSPKTILFRPQLNSTALNTVDSQKKRIVPTSFATASTQEASGNDSTSSSGSSNQVRASEGSTDTDRSISSRKSALSALKSLQKEHNEKCSYLAEHIKKLKQENQEKENRLQKLQNSEKPQET